MKIDMQKLDLENLDELIKHCEDAMVRPLQKKKPEPEPAAEEPESDPAQPDLSDADFDDLVAMYQDVKGD